MPEYTIKQVSAQAGVTPRTVHFYIQQGLLAPPEGAGRGARYTDAHVARLRLIRRLQKEHLPLSEIRRRLATLSDDDVARVLAEGASPAGGAPTSALAYIQRLKSDSRHQRIAPLSTRMAMNAMAVPKSDAPSTSAPASRAQWERIPLDDDLEIHIRRPLTRDRNRLVEKLLAVAKQMLKEEQS